MSKYSKRIHIVGSGPRTGTTLLTEVLRVCYHFDFVCEHEASIYESNKSFGNHDLILSKQPSELYSIDLPLYVDKNLYVICIIRDPRDMVCSFHGSTSQKYWCTLKYWRIFKKSFNILKNHERVLFIKYEDFTKNPDSIQKLISNNFKFLKEKYLFSEYHLYAKPGKSSIKALKSVRPIMANGVGNWKNHLPRLKYQFELHENISEDLIEFGYEPDNLWLERLNGVVIVNDKDKLSHTEEFFTKKNLRKRKIKGILAALRIIIEKTGINSNYIFLPLTKFNRRYKFF
jgi:hypothetical protein